VLPARGEGVGGKGSVEGGENVGKEEQVKVGQEKRVQDQGEILPSPVNALDRLRAVQEPEREGENRK